jgi:hypothetical protein
VEWLKVYALSSNPRTEKTNNKQTNKTQIKFYETSLSRRILIYPVPGLGSRLSSIKIK